MQVSLIFNNSGDEIKFVATNHYVLEYYVEQLNLHHTNNFLVDRLDQPKLLIEQLQTSIRKANEFLPGLLGQSIMAHADVELLNQDTLNQLHCFWVNSQLTNLDISELRNNQPSDIIEKLFHATADNEMIQTLGTALSKLDLNKCYADINKSIHSVEEFFTRPIRFLTEHWVEFPNQFDKNCINNDRFNLSLPFNHLGRTLYNKYQNFDNNLEHNDENTFDQLLGCIEISLGRKETVAYTPEYIQWCRQHKRQPIGNTINIGYIPNLQDSLHTLRQILYTNINNRNSFYIKLI
jgi:hypothetical protein